MAGSLVGYDSSSSEEEDSNSMAKRPRVSSESGMSRDPPAFEISDSESESEHATVAEALRILEAPPNSASPDDTGPAENAAICSRSPSEATSEPEFRGRSAHEETPNQLPGEETSVVPTTTKRRSYAIAEELLPDEMLRFLAEVKRFFTRTVNLSRQSRALAETTFMKSRERLLCYLGYLHRVKKEVPKPEVFLRVQLIEQYLEYLREERQLSAATVGIHASALLYPAKFLHSEHAPDYSDVLIIRQLRSLATTFSREGELERPGTKEELQAANRWLEWDEIVKAVGKQRNYFEMANRPLEKAKECCDLVILAIYVYIPPSRGLEIRTLQIDRDSHNLDPRRFKGQNILLLRRDGDISLHFGDQKTRRFSASEELVLKEDHELCQILNEFIADYRPLLARKVQNDYLLLNRNGELFSSSAFSAHIKNLFFKLTGTVVSINMLRSSFVTWAYSKDNCTVALKTSLAAALRHSTAQAQKTYDRRTLNQKKESAVTLAREFAEGTVNDTERAQATAQVSEECPFKMGAFVAVVDEDSTVSEPKIHIAQVQAILPGGRVRLLWYQSIGSSMYKLTLNGQDWVESVERMIAVKLSPAKKRLGCYRINTSIRTLQKEFMSAQAKH